MNFPASRGEVIVLTLDIIIVKCFVKYLLQKKDSSEVLRILYTCKLPLDDGNGDGRSDGPADEQHEEWNDAGSPAAAAP